MSKSVCSTNECGAEATCAEQHVTTPEARTLRSEAAKQKYWEEAAMLQRKGLGTAAFFWGVVEVVVEGKKQRDTAAEHASKGNPVKKI